MVRAAGSPAGGRASIACDGSYWTPDRRPEELAVLEMRPACERCERALPLDGDARICSYECTFCPACSEEMSGRCPNCGGELLPRPRRATSAG